MAHVYNSITKGGSGVLKVNLPNKHFYLSDIYNGQNAECFPLKHS